MAFDAKELPLSERDIESAWLRDAWEYGSLIHQSAADALVAALDVPSEQHVGHALFSRLYGEMMSATETFAAWILAFRGRERAGLLNAYLAYTPRHVGSVYADARVPSFQAVRYLRLPPAAQLAALTEAFAEPMTIEAATEAFAGIERRLRQLADFRDSNPVALKVHNTLKHGAPLVALFEPDDSRVFETIVLNPARPEVPSAPRYVFASFTVNAAEVRKQHANIREITAGIRELAALARIMFEAGALYANGSSPAGS